MKRRTLIIIAREYTQRVKTKGFIATTIFGPIALSALLFVPIALTILLEDDTQRIIYVLDEADLDVRGLGLPRNVEIRIVNLDEQAVASLVVSESIDGYLLLPEGLREGLAPVKYASREGGGLQFRIELERAVESLVREVRLRESGVGESVREILQAGVEFESVRLSSRGEGQDSTGLVAIIGYVMALTIYLSVFLYGSLVMRSVIEEKTSRIVEIIVSSVRPFQLMMGKVVGVGALGLTQILIWVAAVGLLSLIGGVALTSLPPPPEMAGMGAAAPAAIDIRELAFPNVSSGFLVYLLLFFLGGYLLYASLFATIGSMVEQESDAQQFMIPIAIPIALSILLLPRIVNSPESTISIVASYIPFFSPILMPVRAFVTPIGFWEIPVALVLLFGTFGVAIAICARIYRIGILMYGKRPRITDIVRWARVP
jgi:ABC-2 type transport system permease protein